MRKVVELESLKDKFFDGMSIMVGGFMGCGTPQVLIDYILDLGIKDITLMCNDGAYPTTGVGKLIVANRVKKMYATHIGLNPEVGNQMNDGSMEVVLVPQGTFAERIRCGGAGLGGVLTPTGIGTMVAEGKEVINVDGKDYLLEKPLKADFALIRTSVSDTIGNSIYYGTTNNFNQVMATAADTVIVQAEKLVPTGTLTKEGIHTQSLFVDYIVKGGGKDVY